MFKERILGWVYDKALSGYRSAQRSIFCGITNSYYSGQVSYEVGIPTSYIKTVLTCAGSRGILYTVRRVHLIYPLPSQYCIRISHHLPQCITLYPTIHHSKARQHNQYVKAQPEGSTSGTNTQLAAIQSCAFHHISRQNEQNPFPHRRNKKIQQLTRF